MFTSLVIKKLYATSSLQEGRLLYLHGVQDKMICYLLLLMGRIGHCRNNRPEVVISGESYVCAMATSPNRSKVIVGLADCTLILLASLGGSLQKENTWKHTSPPTAIAYGENIAVGGSDQRIIFFNDYSQVLQAFDYTSDSSEKDYTAAVSSPSGHCIVFATFSRMRVFTLNLSHRQWDISFIVDVNNLYTITTLGFKKDGSKLVVGSLCGAVEIYNASIKQYVLKGKFQVVFISPSQVTVKTISSGKQCTLRTKPTLEISKINVHRDRFVTAYTAESLLCADINTNLVSEIYWNSSGSDKFLFDNPKVCMILNAGELSIVEYGAPKQPLGAIRTEFVHRHLISMRLLERTIVIDGKQEKEVVKKIAYLLDLHTIRIDDLGLRSVASITLDSAIDWLELDSSAKKLLFRDRTHRLHIFDIQSQTRSSLLNYCTFVRWVPDSDVVVAQNRRTLCIWYSTENPEHVTMIPINGDVLDVLRDDNRTEVLIDEGNCQTSLLLNEELIKFGIAIEAKQYDLAVELLETMQEKEGLTMSPELEAMWSNLASLTLQERHTRLAERCYAALNNVSRAHYLRTLNRRLNKGEPQYITNVELSILEKQFKAAEKTLLDHDQVTETIQMYCDLQRYEEAIYVADLRNTPDATELRDYYYRWLTESSQEEKAAMLKEKEGDLETAVTLYLQGGLPARAARIVIDNKMFSDTAVVKSIAEALMKSGLYERAGDLYRVLNMNDLALQAYLTGNAFQPLLELCRKVFPEKAMQMEKEWADWLVSQRQLENAITHYIDARMFTQAVECAMEANQWPRAKEIAERLSDKEQAKPYFSKIAQHYVLVQSFDLAEECFTKAQDYHGAVDMYLQMNLWEKAEEISSKFLSVEETKMLYKTQAKRLESAGRFSEAESLLIFAKETSQAVTMYQNSHRYDDVIRLVTLYHKENLTETYKELASQCTQEGNVKLAEKYYIAGGNWKLAVQMYREMNQLADAMRVANSASGPKAAAHVCWAHAQVLKGEAAVNLLLNHNLVDYAIHRALDEDMYHLAVKIAEGHNNKNLLQEVYLRYAEKLEQDKHYAEAEEEYLKAGDPRSAVVMYNDIQDWDNAARVADQYCPEAHQDIFLAKGSCAENQKDFLRAEHAYLKANKPDIAIEMYKNAGMNGDVSRLVSEYPSFAPAGSGGKVPGSKFSSSIESMLQTGRKDPSYFIKAAKLVQQQNPTQLDDIVDSIAQQLQEQSRYDALAALYLELGNVKQAIMTYAQASMWKEAKELADTKMPSESAAIVSAQLQAYAEAQDWQACIELAKRESPELLAQYSSEYAQFLLSQSRVCEACQLFVDNPVTPFPAHINIFKLLAERVFYSEWTEEKLNEVTLLKEVLTQLVSDLSSSRLQFEENDLDDLERCSLIAHFLNLYHDCKAANLTAISAKIALALLRYIGFIPADKAFYFAGSACKTAGLLPLTIYLFNIYLDVAEAIDNKDETIEVEQFAGTDVPTQLPVPQQHSIPTNLREELRNWLMERIAGSDGTDVSPGNLPTRDCTSCKASVFEPSLVCFSCNTCFPVCIVTGYPVLPNAKVACSLCKREACKDDWNKFVVKMKKCPWCGHPEKPMYM
ncbi:intraflagellar transport protein [Pelomyxa schiedti]|nr:intraflagellar transport protein [Pelomyxa schiedti]